MTIGSIKVAPSLILAPIAGITDRYFRRMVKTMGGCGLVVTEMVSADGLTRGNIQAHELAAFSEEERPIGIQIFGHSPETLARAAEKVQEKRADFVDVNMGCPARKVTSRGAGASLLKKPELVYQVVAQIKRSVSIPVTVKLRSGWDAKSINVLETGKAAEEGGAAAVTLHPRTRRDCFGGRADWRLIRRLKNTLTIPVIGNGDVHVPEDVLRMFEETSCDGVMIGREALKNPWLFLQAEQYLKTGTYDEPSIAQRKQLFFTYYRMLIEAIEEKRWILHKMRKFSGWFSKGMPGGAAFRRKMNETSTIEDLLDAAESIFQRTEGTEINH